MSWLPLADGVFARRFAELDRTGGLVLGRDRCLVLDTGGDAVQGRDVAAEVRERTDLPWVVVLTHGHFDHCFGTSAFSGPASGGCEVWAHPGCAAHLSKTADRQRHTWARSYAEQGKPEVAAALLDAEVVPPNRYVSEATALDLGGRTVWLRHLGRGHTDHDLVVQVPDAGLVFAGDLVEQGAPPDFEDAWPLDWPATLDAVLALRPEVVVPGHGEPVSAAFVAAQHADLAAFADLARQCSAARLTEQDLIARSPFPETVTETALARLRSAGDLP